EARDLHRDLLEERRTCAFFLLLGGHLGQHETVVVAAEAQERHPLFVDVGDLEAEHARVEIDHFREVAAVEADVAYLAYADGVGGVGHGVAPAVNCLFRLEERGFRASLTASIMYTVIPRMKRLPCLAAALACLAAAAFA